MFDIKVAIWTGGGVIAGYALNSALQRLLFSTDSLEQDSQKKPGENEFGYGDDNVNDSGFSNLTLELGSPTSSSVIESTEYPLYSPKENYPDIDGNKTIMARYLTQELYEELSTRKTTANFDFDSCIQIGIDNPEKMNCGLVAGDEECYDVFSEMFDPVITDRHRGYMRSATTHPCSLTADGIISSPFDPKYVKSVHFLVGRNVSGYRFPPSCLRAERKKAEAMLKTALEALTGQFAGRYIHLSNVTRDIRKTLPDVLQGISERPSSKTLECSGSLRDWPNGRGVFYSKDRSLCAWTNREDHLRIMFRDTGLDIAETFQKFCSVVLTLENKLSDNGLKFAFHNSYGYILTCPSGIGTALRAGVHMKLPLLVQDTRFRTVLRELRLHMGTEDSESFSRGYVDFYNMDRLGYSETYLVQHVANAVHSIVEMEKRLEKKHSITDLMPNQTLEDDD